VTPPNFSFDVNLGQVLVTGALTALGWGLRKIYKAAVHAVGQVTHFVERVNSNDELLDVTTTVVDDHTRVLIKEGLIDVPVVRLQRRRRITDPAVFTKQDLS
jgi:hypothetical protein